MIKSKRGQFYLISAIIIVGLLMGLTVVTNTAKKTGIDKTKLYNLFAKVNIEEEKLIKYKPDTTAGYLTSELENILSQFVNIYSSVDKVYIRINNGGLVSYYVYKTSLEKLEDNDIITEFDSYEYGTSTDFYVLIIKEKTEEQYIVMSNA